MKIGTARYHVAIVADWDLEARKNAVLHGQAYGVTARAGRFSAGLFFVPRFNFGIGGRFFVGEVWTYRPGRQYHLRLLWFAAGCHIAPKPWWTGRRERLDNRPQTWDSRRSG